MVISLPQSRKLRTSDIDRMRFLDKTLPCIAENLALDEALLEERDAGRHGPGELLRIWRAESPFVVLGRSSPVELEVNRHLAVAEGIPIFRRVSGGATVLAAPGCLFYSLFLSLEQRPQLRMLDEAHRFVMRRMMEALHPLQPEIQTAGTCDLILGGKKVSGNSVRLVRDWMLYHGTLLLDMDLDLVERLLGRPQREPEYRRGRSHREFINNLHLPEQKVIDSLKNTWQAEDASYPLPMLQVKKLVSEKYSQSKWNFLR